METKVMWLAVFFCFTLETFLSGMETLCRLLGRGYHSGLETFLSGMETNFFPGLGLITRALETFLSGMETRCSAGYPECSRPPLKPSLVEWKQRILLSEGRIIKP